MSKSTPGVTQLGPKRWLVQVALSGQRKTARVRGGRADAEAKRAQFLELLSAPPTSKPTSPVSLAPAASAARLPSLADYLRGEYAKHMAIVHRRSTRETAETSVRYLSYYLGDVRLDAINAAAVRDYITQRRKDGPLTFVPRKDGTPKKASASTSSATTINRDLSLLRAALRHAVELGLLKAAPRVQLLPVDDAAPVVPPTGPDPISWTVVMS